MNLIRGCNVERIGERWLGQVTYFTFAGESKFGRKTSMPDYEFDKAGSHLMDSQIEAWVEVNRMIQEFHATGKIEVTKYNETPRR